jgi:hypothetical protein
MSSFAQPAIPPPPAPLAGTFAGSDFDGLESASQTPPYDEATDVLIRMGDPPHPHLDEAIAKCDRVCVLKELTRIRSQYPQHTVGLNTAVSYALHCGQVDILDLLLSCGISVKLSNLQAAIAQGNIPMIERLVAALPGSLNSILENGHTALTYV